MKTPTTFDGLVEQRTVEHPLVPFEYETYYVSKASVAHRYDLNDGQDNHEYEEAVYSDPGPVLSSQPHGCSRSPTALLNVGMTLTQLLLPCCFFQAFC